VTFEELAGDLVRDYTVNKRKAVKIIEYPIKHLRKSFGLSRAFDLTTDRINAHIERRQQEGAKNATINRELAALKRMFSLAVQAQSYLRSRISLHLKKTTPGKNSWTTAVFLA
jgi:site-specific recombinase XerD